MEDALANVRDWFPDLSEQALADPLEQAFALATEAARGEREFHEVFETELRRAIEERDVLGAPGSVLPAGSSERPQAFASAGAQEPAVSLVESMHQREEGPQYPEDGQPHPEDGADNAARDFVLAVGALRFRDGLSPEATQRRLGIDAGYYTDSMRWLLATVDRALERQPPLHADPARLADFAAGLLGAEESFASERHLRDCRACASYFEDLLDGTRRAVGTALADAEQAPSGTVVYTSENGWARFGRRPRRRGHTPLPLTLKRDDLRKYAGPAAPPRDAQGQAEQRRRVPHRRLGSFRLRQLVPVALAGAVVAVVAVALTALSGGDADRGSRDAFAASKSRMTATAIRRESAARATENQARPKRRRTARERRARLRSPGRQAPARPVTEAQAVAEAPAPAPAPVAPAPAPLPPAPATPSTEFGLEP